jgi:replicative DNA helicase
MDSETRREDTGTYNESFGLPYQEHVLAVLARAPGTIIQYRSALDDAYFGSDIHRLIAKALFKHVDHYASLPTRVTLIESVRAISSDKAHDRAKEIIKRIYKKDISDSASVTDRLVEFGKLQAAVNATLENADDLNRGDRSKILTRMHEVSLVGEDIVNIGSSYKATIEERRQWYDDDDESSVIPTGMHFLDLMLNGGGRRGELNVILGKSKAGKSQLLANVAYGAFTSRKKFNVVHYSCEMRKPLVMRRYDARLSGHGFKYRHTNLDKYLKIVQERAERLVRGGLFVHYLPTRTLTPSRMRLHLSLLISRGYSPDCVCVDYADIMRPERRLGETRNEIAGIFEDLRTIAGEYNVAMWTPTQAKTISPDRIKSGDVLRMEDMAESREKADILDALISLNQTEQEKIDRRCRIFGAAIRNGEDGGTVEGTFEKNRCRLITDRLLDHTQAVIAGADDEEDEEEEETEETIRRKALKKKVLKKPRRAA